MKALIILNFLDDIEKQRTEILALKRALVSGGMVEPAKLFPDELGPPVKELDEIQHDQNVKFDYSDVTWKSGGDAFAEYQQLMDQIGAARHGRMSGDALAQRPEWTDWG